MASVKQEAGARASWRRQAIPGGPHATGISAADGDRPRSGSQCTGRPRRSAIVLSNRIERVNDPAIGNGPTGMDGVRRDDGYGPWTEPKGLSGDGQLEFAFDHVDHLFVHVRVLG